MSLYTRKDSPFWWYQITGFGKAIQKSTGTTDKKLAQEILDRVKAQLWEQKRFGVKPRYLWQEAVVNWLKATSSKATHDEDKSKLQWLDQFLSDLYLDQINLDVIELIISKKLETASEATTNRYLALIRSILLRCRDVLRWIDTVPKITLFKESNDRERCLTNYEAMRLLSELPEHQRMIVMFALATGLRQSNVVKMEWEQIDFKNRHAHVRLGKSKNRKALGVPLNEKALEVLELQRNKHPVRVFTYKGEPFNSANTAAWKKALKRAGIKDFRWHDLRHTWATWQRKQGTPTHELQKLGGWLTAAMVERYAHVAPEGLEIAASRLDSVLSGYDLVTSD